MTATLCVCVCVLSFRLAGRRPQSRGHSPAQRVNGSAVNGVLSEAPLEIRDGCFQTPPPPQSPSSTPYFVLFGFVRVKRLQLSLI